VSAKNLQEESRRKGLEYARQFPSRIADVREIFSKVANEVGQTGQSDFEVRSDLYLLLSEAPTPAQRNEVLRAYRDALDEVDREGRLDLQLAWQATFGGALLTEAIVDGPHGQILAVTVPKSESKESRGGVCALKISDGNRVWSHTSKKNFSPWLPVLGTDKLFFGDQYHGDSDFGDGPTSHIWVLSLLNGALEWKMVAEEGISGARVLGLFNEQPIYLGDGLVVLDPSSGIERWKQESFCPGGIKLFLPGKDALCMQYRKLEIGWFSPTGKLLKKLVLRGPKKDEEGDEGQIDLALADADTIYACAWGSWRDWLNDKPQPGTEATIIYAIDRKSRKIKWQTPAITDARFLAVLPHGKVLYFCGESSSLAVDKETGKVKEELPYRVLHVGGKLIFHSTQKDRWDDGPFTFYACDLRTKKVRWQRNNFELLLTHNRMLIGRVGVKTLVVLDEKTGKELSAVAVRDPLAVTAVGDKEFLVRDREALSMFRFSDG